MTFTTDPTTVYGQLRLLTTDRDTNNPIYQDADYDAFLALENNVTKLAAALALESIAVDQVLVLKVMTTLGLQTRGDLVSKALLDRAQALRDSVNDVGDLWDYAEFDLTPWQTREIILNKALRGQI